MKKLLKILIIAIIYCVGYTCCLTLSNLLHFSYQLQLSILIVYGGFFGYFLFYLWKYFSGD
jgi:hypothetical protein